MAKLMAEIESMDSPGRSICPFREEDEAEVAGVWHHSGLATYTYFPAWQAITLEAAQRVFHDILLPNCAIWVGTADGRVVAYLAVEGSHIDRLYVDPTEWRQGWGTRSIASAKYLAAEGLELHTHQQNHATCALYERHGFIAVIYGVSPPPESAPDVEYHWRPGESRSSSCLFSRGSGPGFLHFICFPAPLLRPLQGQATFGFGFPPRDGRIP